MQVKTKIYPNRAAKVCQSLLERICPNHI
jgi:hypothetical protein